MPIDLGAVTAERPITCNTAHLLLLPPRVFTSSVCRDTAGKANTACTMECRFWPRARQHWRLQQQPQRWQQRCVASRASECLAEIVAVPCMLACAVTPPVSASAVFCLCL